MSVILDGTSGITTPGLTNTGSETVLNLTTSGNTILGDTTTDTLNVGAGGLVKDSSGNVGIGTASPAAKLDVDTSQDTATSIRIGNTNAGSSAQARLLVVADAGNIQVKAMSAANTTYGAADCGVINCDNMGGGLRIAHNDSVKMIIDSSGNVGIGTTSPAAPLNVYGNTTISTSDYYSSTFSTKINSAASGTTTASIGLSSYTNSSACNASIHVVPTGGGYRSGLVTTYSADGSGGYCAWNQFSPSGASTTERLRIDSDGRILSNGLTSALGTTGGFGSKTTDAGLQNFTGWNTASSGTIYFAYYGTGATFTATGSITSTGSNCLFNNLSDVRMKENIIDAGSGLEKLKNVKVRSFDWKKTKEHNDFGVIAQELVEVAPECVTKGTDNEDGSIDKPWQVDTSVLVPALIKAVQELKAEVDALKAAK